MIHPENRLLILQANLTMCWDTTFTAFSIPVRVALVLSRASNQHGDRSSRVSITLLARWTDCLDVWLQQVTTAFDVPLQTWAWCDPAPSVSSRISL
jgi:hypothetical protein